MFASTAMISKSISKSNSKYKSAFGAKSKAAAVANHWLAEAATNDQIRAASLRATENCHTKEVFVARTHLQLFMQKIAETMHDAESKALLHSLYAEAAAESTQMGMGLELHALPAPATAAPVGRDYDDDSDDSDDEAPPPPTVSSKSKTNTKPAKGRGSGTSRPDMKGKRSGWNLFRQNVVTTAPSTAFVERDEALTPAQREEKTDKGRPAHPPWTKEAGSKHTDAGIFETWKNLTSEQKASWNARAADEWEALVTARARAAASAPSGSDIFVEAPDDAELTMPLGGAASATASDDNDAPPKSKSKRPVEEPEEAEEEAEEAEEEAAAAAAAAKRTAKRSAKRTRRDRAAAAAEEAEEPAEEEPAEEEPAEEEPATDPTTAEDLFGEEE